MTDTTKVALTIHLAACLGALFFGAVVLFRKKQSHRRNGSAYVGFLTLLGLSGLVIYKGGPWNATHYLALISVAAVLVALYFLYTYRHKRHGLAMKISVIALYFEVVAEIYYRVL